MKEYKYLIIGGGVAADAAVNGIRESDDKGSIGLISAESDPPYARPPLSKDLWTSDMPTEKIWRNTENKGAEIIQKTKIVSLDINAHTATDQKDQEYSYNKLLIATGGRPRRLPFGDGNIVYFRTYDDYKCLRKMTENAQHFAILGGGFIGSEIAAALKSIDKQVTMVFPEAAIGGLLLPSDFASKLSAYYAEQGITVVNGCKPSSIESEGDLTTIGLENGHKFTVDGVVAGIGIEPNTALAENAGLEINNGIVVNEQLQTKDPHIFSAGDVTNFYNPIMNERMRVEHIDNAFEMGETAGRNMAGGKEPYHHLPFFYSDLFDYGFEAVGKTDPSMETFSSINTPDEKGCIFYMENKRVRGIIFWNISDKVHAGRELLASTGEKTVEDLKKWEQERLS